jgi:hypothetical protein
VRVRAVLIGAVVIAVLAAIGIWVAVTQFGKRLPAPLVIASCTVRTPSGSVSLSPAQMANAATIAAVGLRRQLPDRALVVALAAALQESKLENLAAGDRDSVGLFQQRPSQGWGTAEQIRDPRYAAGKFYSALVRVRGWEAMRVTDAAQRVQRSAFPEAYEKWATDSAVLAEGLAGRAPSALTCSGADEPAVRGAEAARALGEGLKLDWGTVDAVSTAEIVGLVVAAANDQSGWQFAHWLVAHSWSTGVHRVQFGAHEWTAASGKWRQVQVATVDRQVVAEVYRS